MQASHPYYIIRAIGGGLYFLGAVIMAYNLWRTARGDVPAHERATDVPAAGVVAAAE